MKLYLYSIVFKLEGTIVEEKSILSNSVTPLIVFVVEGCLVSV